MGKKKNSNINNRNELDVINGKNEIIEFTEDVLMDTKASTYNTKAISVPIGELSTLGLGVSSLVPVFNKVTQTASFAADGLYRIANANAGDTLKLAKNGNAWGAMKTATGKSKMVQLSKADPLTVAEKCNPDMILMAAALYSIEKKLDEIAETQKKILTFLEIENESQIEADVESLMDILSNYKYNWDNELSRTSSHKLVMDI